MVMDNDDDVERLFSWIRTPDLHYREFASERDLADAVAAWPMPRRTADDTARRDHRRDADIDVERGPSAAERTALSERLATLFGRREPPPASPSAFEPAETREPPPEEPADDLPSEPEPPAPPAIFARLEPTRPPGAPIPTHVRPPDRDYRGYEETAAQATPEEPPAGEARSLNAIFSRVAHPSPAPRDDRKRASGGGLGSVFSRLR